MAHRSGRFKYRAEYNLNQYDLPDEDHARRAYGYVQAYHKRQWKESPYRIPNEYICTRLGDLIGLPVPPCVLTYCDVLDSPTIFSSLNFNVDKNNLPPIEPDCCVKHLPMLSSGVLLFDIWIANEDRHEENLTVDDLMQPTVMRVFDHDQALFGGFKSVGIPRLNKLEYRLGVTGSTVTGGNKHCLLEEVNTIEHFDEWFNRIWETPNTFIRSLCNDMARCELITRDESQAAVGFLTYRKHHLKELIDANRAAFTSITEWKLPGRLF